MIIHRVKSGDTLYRLAEQYGVPLDDIIDANDIADPDIISVGQTIIIPTINKVHVVKSGQSLYTIAKSHGIELRALLDANPNLKPPYTIYPGQLITIPVESEKLGEIEVNGFLYPNITDDNLQKTLPNLTYVSIFSTNITASGELQPPDGEARIIAAAKRFKVAPMMVLTNLESGKGFNSDLVSGFLNSAASKTRLINNVIEAMKSKGYYGLNVDLEYIPMKDREMYNAFLKELKAKLSASGFILTTDLAPKISDTQKGILYESHDYAANGMIADRVILMTYEWGYIAGPPMAVSPFNEIKRVLDYAVSRIPADKILMSLPGYGYDWTLPFKNGTRAKILNVTAATQLAERTGSVIEFDEDAQTPFFEYYDGNGNLHIVWFEDAVSAREKLKLIDEYGLAGVSYWTVNQFWPQNWITLKSMYDVKKIVQ